MELSITREIEVKMQRKPRVETGLVLLSELSSAVGSKLSARLSFLVIQVNRFPLPTPFGERRFKQCELDPASGHGTVDKHSLCAK